MFKRIRLEARNWVLDGKKTKTPESRGIKKVTMCKKCYTFYYKSSWHFERPSYLNFDHDEEVPVRFTECPACIEQEVALCEMESGLILGSG